MFTQEQIADCASRLRAAYEPKEIILFGSYAWGTPNDDSDLDFCVIVKDSPKPYYLRSQDGERAMFGTRIPTDILVPTELELQERMRIDPKGIFSEIIQRGVRC